MRRSHEMVYEHPKGAKLKLTQKNISSVQVGRSYKWVLEWQAPEGTSWNEIGTWSKRSVDAHLKAFREARDSMDHVEFNPIRNGWKPNEITV